MTCYPGCYETASGLYRALVIVTHRGVYFSPKPAEFPSRAVSDAKLAIQDGSYQDWHSHKIEGEA